MPFESGMSLFILTIMSSYMMNVLLWYDFFFLQMNWGFYQTTGSVWSTKSGHEATSSSQAFTRLLESKTLCFLDSHSSNASFATISRPKLVGFRATNASVVDLPFARVGLPLSEALKAVSGATFPSGAQFASSVGWCSASKPLSGPWCSFDVCCWGTGRAVRPPSDEPNLTGSRSSFSRTCKMVWRMMGNPGISLRLPTPVMITRSSFTQYPAQPNASVDYGLRNWNDSNLSAEQRQHQRGPVKYDRNINGDLSSKDRKGPHLGCSAPL